MQFGYALLGETCTSVIMIGVVGEVTLGQIKTPLFLTGLSVSLAESRRFELLHPS